MTSFVTNTYRIRPDKIRHIAITDLKNQGLASLIIMTITDGSLLLMSRETNAPIFIFILSFILTLALMFGFLLYLYKFKIFYYSSYTILVDTKFLYKKIAIDEDSIQKGLIKGAWNRSKQLANQYDIRIGWDDIKKVKSKNKGLIVYTSSPYKRIFIPFDIENFQELESYIKQKTD